MMLNAVTVQHGKTAGFTLVELMIALVLGLLVIAGVGSVFLANQNAYRTNVALGEAQESARISFEFLARDIRSAGANPDRKSTRLNSSHVRISYAVFCLKK